MKYAALLLLSVLAFIAIPAHAAPKGAVKLPASSTFRYGDFYCGKIKKKWLPGRLLPRNWFYSNSEERKNLLIRIRASSGKKKKKLQAQAKALQAQIVSRTQICAAGPRQATPTPISTPTPTEPTPISTATPTPTATPDRAIRFGLTNAVGLALTNPIMAARRTMQAVVGNASSNLRTVDSAGQTAEALVNGQATISKFLIAPNDKLYVLFQQKTNLEDSTTPYNGTGCLLAEVDVTTGAPTCIDSTVDTIDWLSRPKNSAIQFDASGAIYYLARSSGNALLRRYSNGTHTDLINQNITIMDYLVLSDGSAIVYGSTNNTQSWWLRRITPAGGLQTIRNIQACNAGVTFMKIFPDGKIYFGIDDCNLTGVYRMGVSASDLEDNAWFGYTSRNGQPLPPPVNYDCSPPLENVEEWLYSCGTHVDDLLVTPSQKVFGVTTIGWNNLRKALVRYYDAYFRPTLTVKQVKVFQSVLSNVFLAGLDDSGRNILTVYDISADGETALITANNEIEIYHLNYVSADNKIMFDGLRFSDNKYVIGQVDLNTMQVVASQTGGTKLVDFQTF